MSTTVLDLDLAHFPPTVSVAERYSRALVLIRLHGRPVGQTTVPVVSGRLGGDDLHEQLLRTAGWRLCECWLHDVLEWEDVPVLDPLPRATVAVCTRDRPEDIERCLASLLKLPDDGQEVLVIDNCPSDEATFKIVQSYNKRDGRPIRYVREDRPGLDCARNRALREAKHDVVAFTDDDAVPDPGWLRALVRNFGDPLVLCVTGLTMPLELETKAQEAFERYSTFARGFRRVEWDSTKLPPLAAGKVGAGVNMALRRSVIETVGPFDEALDVGTPTRSGGDNEMFSRILTAGYRIVYDPAALSWHRHRRTWQELHRTFYGYGVGVYAAWTRSLLREREWSVFKLAWQWFRYTQLRALHRALRKRADSKPLDLVVAELRGCLAGPWAYLDSCKQLRASEDTR
jgi:glycosyltransferase involved in cell wall biosynthesis